MMPSLTPEPLRTPAVALSVRPPLLRELLTRVLSADGVDVVVVPDDPSTLAIDVVNREYDIAIVSGAIPPGIEADLVLIVDPPDGEPPVNPPLTRSSDVIDIDQLSDVVAEIERWRRVHAGVRR